MSVQSRLRLNLNYRKIGSPNKVWFPASKSDYGGALGANSASDTHNRRADSHNRKIDRADSSGSPDYHKHGRRLRSPLTRNYDAVRPFEIGLRPPARRRRTVPSVEIGGHEGCQPCPSFPIFKS